MNLLGITSSFKALLAISALAVSVVCAPLAVAEKYASIVIDADTQEVLHARNADEARYPASLTKVMTLYMLFDALKSGEVTLNENLPVSRFAAGQAPSNLKLRSGSTIKVRDAIDALVTKSANDVAVVVAERLGGSERRFAQLMTAKAHSLGLTNTTFRNASGLPDDQQTSTARDLAILAEAMLENHADYYHYFSSTKFTWGGRSYKNHNELLGTVAGVDGIKTGYTRASGFNLMTSAKRDGHRIVAVMLGGNSSKSRNAHVEALVEAAFASLNAQDDLNDPGLRTRLAFASVGVPVDPNGAAEPMLNGVRLSVLNAATGAGDEDSEGMEDMTQLEPLVTAPATKLAALPPAPQIESDVALSRILNRAEVSNTPPPAPLPQSTALPSIVTVAPTLTVEEYQARQLGKTR